MSKRGPRTGEDTRSMILVAARQRFASDGYPATSLRSIARDAGVDPALVHHYFDGKAELFDEALRSWEAPPEDRGQLLDDLLAGPRENVGAAALRSYLDAWEDPEGIQRYLAIVRAACSTDGAEVAAAFSAGRLLEKLATELGVDHPERRAAIVASIFMGVGFMRHVVRRAVIAEASLDDLVAMFGPAVNDALFGEVAD